MFMKPKSSVKNPRALIYKRYNVVKIALNSGGGTIYQYTNESGLKRRFLFDYETMSFIETQNTENDSNIKYISLSNIYSYETLGVIYYFKYNEIKGDFDIVESTTKIIDLDISKRYYVDSNNYYNCYTFNEDGTYSYEHLDNHEKEDIEFKDTFVDEDYMKGSSNICYRLTTSQGVFYYYVIYYTNEDSYGRIICTIKESDIPSKISSYFIDSYQKIIQSTISKYQKNKYYYAGSFDYMIRGSSEETTTQFLKGNIMDLKTMSIKYYNDNINLKVDDMVVIDNRVYAVESIETNIKRLPKPFKIYFARLNSIM